MPVRINSALYYTDYTDMQRTAEDTNVNTAVSNPLKANEFGGATFNAGKAKIMGFETNAIIQPTDGLTLSANYAFTYGKYDTYTVQANTNALPLVDCSGHGVPNNGTADFSCIPFQYTPRHQFSVSSNYRLPLAESIGRIDGTVTFSWTDRQYSSAASVPQEEPGAWLDTYGLLNASVNWTAIYGSAFDVQLFGTNLTDRTYRVSNSNVWDALYFQSSIYGEPRIFGANVSYHWGS
jgi:iron complex outermembrane receptor protein